MQPKNKVIYLLLNLYSLIFFKSILENIIEQSKKITETHGGA